MFSSNTVEHVLSFVVSAAQVTLLWWKYLILCRKSSILCLVCPYMLLISVTLPLHACCRIRFKRYRLIMPRVFLLAITTETAISCICTSLVELLFYRSLQKLATVMWIFCGFFKEIICYMSVCLCETVVFGNCDSVPRAVLADLCLPVCCHRFAVGSLL